MTHPTVVEVLHPDPPTEDVRVRAATVRGTVNRMSHPSIGHSVSRQSRSNPSSLAAQATLYVHIGKIISKAGLTGANTWLAKLAKSLAHMRRDRRAAHDHGEDDKKDDIETLGSEWSTFQGWFILVVFLVCIDSTLPDLEKNEKKKKVADN